MSALGLLLLSLCAVAGVSLGVALLMATTTRLWLPRVEALPPARRSWALLVASAAPLLAGLGFTALCFAPKALSLAGDHCTTHGGDHAHFCFSHLPDSAGSPLAWLVVLTLVAVVGARAASLLVEAVRARRSVALLLSGAREDADVHVVPATTPIALSTGLLRQRVVISSALIATLPAPLLAAVVAHERAHSRRRDVLRAFVASLLATAHLPTLRRRLLTSLDLAAELASDAEAAAVVGDRLLVARALLAVERLAHATPAHAALGAPLGGSAVPRRVEALLSPEPAVGRTLSWIFAPLLLAAALLADPLHHAAETLFGFIAGM